MGNYELHLITHSVRGQCLHFQNTLLLQTMTNASHEARNLSHEARKRSIVSSGVPLSGCDHFSLYRDVRQMANDRWSRGLAVGWSQGSRSGERCTRGRNMHSSGAIMCTEEDDDFLHFWTRPRCRFREKNSTKQRIQKRSNRE